MTKILPAENETATLLGRAFVPEVNGPAVITICRGRAIDITSLDAPTVRDICEKSNPAKYVQDSIKNGTDLGSIERLASNSTLAPRTLRFTSSKGIGCHFCD